MTRRVFPAYSQANPNQLHVNFQGKPEQTQEILTAGQISARWTGTLNK